MIQTFLRSTNSIDHFKKLDFHKDYGFLRAGAIRSDLQKNQWQLVLTAVEGLKPKRSMLKHIAYVEAMVVASEKASLEERKDIFKDDWHD